MLGKAAASKATSDDKMDRDSVMDELIEEISEEAYECVARKDRKGFAKALRLAAKAMQRRGEAAD